MRLNDDEASGREGPQQGGEKMCQTAGREAGLFLHKPYIYRNTISGREKLVSSPNVVTGSQG